MVELAFFENETSNETKAKMVLAQQNAGEDEPQKRIKIDLTSIENLQLESFVTENAFNFFNILELPTTYLTTLNPDKWIENEFQQAVKFVKSLQVVNDRAERGLKLIQDVNCSITKNEEQKQFLPQVVSEHRSKFPLPQKSLLINGTKSSKNDGNKNQ